MKKVLSLIILLVIGVGTAVAMSDKHPSGTWRYRVTVEIDTPEGVKSGSSVHELSVATPLIDLPDVGNPARIKGEAIVVDLGERGVVFALMSDQSWQNGLYQAFPTEAPSSTEGIQYYMDTLKLGMTEEWKKNKPSMVTFTDISDPKTVRGVGGEAMEKILGEGVTFKKITVEITGDPVTWKIEKWLPWLYGLNGHYLHGGMTSRKAPLGLHAGHFRKGNK